MARGYKEEDMVVLTDASRDPRSIPTRQNITAAMHWLVRGAQPGDALFFEYSGHGGQAKASQGDEADGMNETILPVDYATAGQMEDDELHSIMVRPLPMGCRLTAIFDSCHSGTVLDLPYVYSTSGKIKVSVDRMHTTLFRHQEYLLTLIETLLLQTGTQRRRRRRQRSDGCSYELRSRRCRRYAQGSDGYLYRGQEHRLGRGDYQADKVEPCRCGNVLWLQGLADVCRCSRSWKGYGSNELGIHYGHAASWQ